MVAVGVSGFIEDGSGMSILRWRQRSRKVREVSEIVHV